MTQDTALSILKTGVNVFLTGEPGSGKTHTVNRYVAYLKERSIKAAITASTGIAATHIGGMTIHSWSGIGIKKELTPADISKIGKYKAKKIKKASVLIIDEISMLDGNTLSLVDRVIKSVRHSESSFGGMQVVFVGDFFQLPPVHRSGDDAPQFSFQSDAWISANPSVCYLSEQHRQSDSVFSELLGAIRLGDINEDHLKYLDSRLAKSGSVEVKDLTKLFPHNADVDRINAVELERIPGKAVSFTMEDHGNDGLVEQLKRGCLSPEKLELKKDAVVMFTKNDFEMKFVNGTLGTIVSFDADGGYPVVRTREGKHIYTSPMSWAVEDDDKVLAEIRQVPLRLAWAMTVHKSQGITLDAAFMDLRGSFVEGQGYVALSRVRSLDGLYLAGYNAKALMVHQDIIDQDQSFRTLSVEAEKAHQKLTSEEINQLHQYFLFSFGGLSGFEIKSSDAERSLVENSLLDKTKAYSVEATAHKPSSRRMTAIRVDHPKAYSSWSYEEEEELSNHFRSGMPTKMISDLIGRKPGAIRSRLRKLGFIE